MSAFHHPAWTDERVELLRQCVANGLSAAQAGLKLGTTRNTAMAKAHRLGLKFGVQRTDEQHAALMRGGAAKSASKATAAKGLATKRATGVRVGRPALIPSNYDIRPHDSPLQRRLTVIGANVAARAEPGPIKLRDEPPGQCTMTTLRPHLCKWPIGEPGSDDLTFCGQPQDGKRPYCVQHSKRAFVAAPPRKPKTEPTGRRFA
jgi:GcrA cell cycle regulator